MLELTKKRLQFKVDEGTYEIVYPSLKAFSNYQKEVKKHEGDEAEMAINFLVKLGLDQQVAEELEVDHVLAIMEEISGNVKKK